MNPKCIILKTQSINVFNAFLYKLNEIKNIRFFNFKINGWYTVVIKCHNYYNRQDIFTDSKMLKAASDCAGKVLDEDPLLEGEKNRGLSEKVSEYTLKCLSKLNL